MFYKVFHDMFIV